MRKQSKIFNLNPGEHVLFEGKPSLAYRYQLCWVAVQSIMIYLLILVGVGYFKQHTGNGQSVSAMISSALEIKAWFLQLSSAGQSLCVLGILALLCAIFMCFTTRLPQYRYMITNQRCIIQTGIWSNQVKVLSLQIPYDLRVLQSWVETRLQLYRVRLTQASSVGTARVKRPKKQIYLLEGLSKSQANEVSKLLNVPNRNNYTAPI